MADNLESYFKKHLSGDSPDEENWNLPSDDVWNKVQPKIQKKKGLFIPWKYFYLLGILFAVVLAFILWPSPTSDNSIQNKQELLTEENTQVPQILNEPNEGYKNTSRATSDSKTPIEKSLLSETNPTDLDAQRENTTTAEPFTPEVRLSTTVGSEIIQTEFGNNNSQNRVFEEDKEKGNNKFANNSTLDSEAENFRIKKLSKKTIDNISLSAIAVPIQKTTTASFATTENTINKKEPISSKGKFGIGAFFAPTFTSTYVKGDLSKGKIEIGNMFLYSGNWGIELKYYISNRFTLVTGIGKSEIKSWSKSLIEFNYDLSTEHTMPTGEKENTSPVPMQTPFGEINTEITYRFPGDQEIPDGEPMYSVMETHQELKYLSIPLGVEFNIIRFSRFNWFADAGVRYNRALKDATQFTSRVLHNGHDMDVVTEQMTGHPTYTENYLNFYVGTGINYRFSKSFQISGAANYFGNITKVNLQQNMSTYVHSFNLKFGIVYIF